MVRETGVVVGAGGHALVCIEVLRSAGLEVLGCVSIDGSAAADLAAIDVEMIGTTADLGELLTAGRWVFVAVGDNETRRELTETVARHGAELKSAISPSAVVSPSATVEPGALVMPGALINAQARIGRGAIINTGAIIDHECSIGSFAHVAPGAALAGAVDVGDGALIGIGSRVLPHRTIGPRAIIGAGATVTTDIGADTTAVGIPARAISARSPTAEQPGSAGPAGSTADDGESVDSPARIPNILIVCTGNLNRSPLAEVLLRRQLDGIGANAEVSSAGLAAPLGSRVDNKLLRVARELGVGDEIDAHRSTQLTPGDLARADLVIAMTREHLDELDRFGAVAGRSTTLRTASWRSRVIGRQELSFDEWVSRLTTEISESPTSGASADDVADPIGGRMRQYRAMGSEVSELVDTLVGHWCGR